MGEVKLENVSTVALDTAALIYYVEAHPTYCSLVEPVIEAIDKAEVIGITSTITLLEVLVLPFREGNSVLAQEYRSILLHSNLRLISLTYDIAEKAAEIRARHNLRTPDSVQVATAILNNADLLIANDKKWKKITEVNVVILDEII
jgi:predicted nucleic acid-binding protein